MKGGENVSKKKLKAKREQPKEEQVELDTSVDVLIKATNFNEALLSLGYSKLSDNPEIKIGVDKIADLISSMTIRLMENTDNGDKRVFNELSRKIDVNPYKKMTRKGWLYKIVYDLLLSGNGNSVVYPIIKNNLIADLKPLIMSQVSWNVDDDSDYSINYGGKVYHSDEIVHFVLNPDPNNPWIGTGYRANLKEIVDNLRQATKTKKGFMSGQYMPSVIVKVDSGSTELASEAGRESVKKKYLGESKPGEPWIIPAELLDVQSVKPLSLQDIAINDSVQLDKKTVAGLLGVPAFFLGVGEFKKEEYRNFVNTRVMGISQVIAQTLTRDLLYSPTMYFDLNPRSLMAYDLPELVTAGKPLVEINALRRNELRNWIGLDPDSEMNELIVLENYIPQDKLGDQGKLKGGDD